MSRGNLNLVLALVWLVGAILAWLNPGAYNEWIAWLALGMCGYNLVRWWLLRSANPAPPPAWRHSRRRPPVEQPEISFKLEDEPLPEAKDKSDAKPPIGDTGRNSGQ